MDKKMCVFGVHGGGLCGKTRYRLELDGAEVVDTCHCSACRRASGAPMTAWAQVAPAKFALLQGAPRGYESSPGTRRWFCPDCGAQLYMTDADGRSVGVTLGTLDEPGSVRPTVHGWTAERVDWLALADGLPEFPGTPPHDL
jgi:hypothetical protein